MTEAECNKSWLLQGSIIPNATSDENGEVARTLGITIGIFDICVGSIGNLLTIVAIMGNPKLRTTFHAFIVSLCFVDFCTATFMMPFNVASYVQRKWPFGNDHITCAIQAYFYYCCGYSSVVCLIVITVNRYIGILYPNKYEEMFSRKFMIATIIFSWLFAPVVMSVFFFISDTPGEHGYGWVQKYSLCVFKTKGEIERKYMVFTRILFQGVPLIIMVILYSHIFYSVRKSGKTIAKMSLKSAESDIGENSFGDYSINNINNHIRDNSMAASDSEQETNRETRTYSRNPTPSTVRRIEQLMANNADAASTASSEDSRARSWASSVMKSTVSFDENIHEIGIPNLQNDKQNRQKKMKGVIGISSVAAYLNKRLSKRSKSKSKSMYATSLYQTIRKRQKMDKRLLSISVTICIVFSIMFYPSVLLNLFPCARYFSANAHKCASIITWFNSCVNPVIYAFMNPKLREQYKYMIRSFRRKVTGLIRNDQHSHTSPSPAYSARSIPGRCR